MFKSLVFSLLVTSVVASCATLQTDQRIADSVAAEIEWGLPYVPMEVLVSHGIVTLKGVVPHDAYRVVAIELAMSVEGVVSVVDRLETYDGPVPAAHASSDEPAYSLSGRGNASQGPTDPPPDDQGPTDPHPHPDPGDSPPDGRKHNGPPAD